MTLLMEDGGEFNERIPAPILNVGLTDYEYIVKPIFFTPKKE